MAIIYYLRHGQSLSNINNTFSGSQDDALLTPLGEQQANDAGEKIKVEGIVFDRVICSPLGRTRKTADIVCKIIGFDLSAIEIDQRIQEYDMGELTGKDRVNVTSVELISAVGAEDPHAFMERVVSVLKELEKYSGTVLLVSHAGVGNIIRCYKDNLDPRGFFDLQPYPNATPVAL